MRNPPSYPDPPLIPGASLIRPVAFLALFLSLLLLAPRARATEPWSDDRLPVRDGLEIWFDASRQNAGRAALQLPPLGSGNPMDYLIDGSGRGRRLSQSAREARPRFRQEFDGAYLSFDGHGQALSASWPGAKLQSATIFLVGALRSNAGGFRAFLGLSQAGRNDYSTGLNFDLGEAASPNLSFLNAEGAGFAGMTRLFQGAALPFGGWHVFRLESRPGPRGVTLALDGQARGARDRADSVMSADEFVLGARRYSNETDPPFLQGFLDGEIAEFLLYDRPLPYADKAAIEGYLTKKYGLLLQRPPGVSDGSSPLAPETNPPPVQMFAPGFTVRELPVELPNVNNVRYRPDGKLVALGYNGQIWLLSDTNGGGLEDHAEPFWTNSTLRAPIGMALTPPGYARGEGVFVAAKGKLSLIVDTNGDGRADTEIIVADGWKELSHGVDALGAAVDQEGNIYFGLGTASFTEPYLVDKATGAARYDLGSERGTILKVSPDFQRREIVCTGIRFPVGLAFNRAGDLFCTDQEGATWLPNGNPFDELLQVKPGRHYGFPPRHPKYLPGVIDEPSVFDYGPQHQSACGLSFNESINGGPVFGPAWWAGDAIVCGYSRGKIWRTKLVPTAGGYVARNQQIASLPVLTVDACVSPGGDLVVATHGGEPDWGSGPTGSGRLYKISYTGTNQPQPLLAWSESPVELRVGFDRALDPPTLTNLARRVAITRGRYVSPGDRFEVKRPGYAAVYAQLAEPRYAVPVLGASLTPDLTTLILRVQQQEAAVNYAITIRNFDSSAPADADQARDVSQEGRGARRAPIPQRPDLDLSTDLTGLAGAWSPASPAASAWSGWLPHLDLDVSRQLTRGSAPHDALWSKLGQPGVLTLRGQLNLYEMLQPAIQPGSKLDYERPAESVTVLFSAAVPFTIEAGGQTIRSTNGAGGLQQAAVRREGKPQDWLPFTCSFETGPAPPGLTAAWFTADDPRPRAFPLRRFLLPWARPDDSRATAPAATPRPELTGGNWTRGRRLFFGETVACSKCHTIHGRGGRVGPDLSNLAQRDYASVLKDIKEPNAAINPDHLAYNIQLTDSEELTAVIQTENKDEITVADVSGRSRTFPRGRVKSILASKVSLMPEGLDKALSEPQLADLMTFLLTSPLEPAPLEAAGAPPPRKRSEVEAALRAGAGADQASPGDAAPVPFNIVLCAGPKDHGPGEHDYPLWQSRWARLLALAENVNVSTSWAWPSAEQWRTAGVVVFYSDNPGWNTNHAAELEAFLDRGGGAVFLHYAVDGHEQVEDLARSTGLAWRGGFSKFRHGPLDLRLQPGPLTAGLGRVKFVDESYWNLVGKLDDARLLATNIEEEEPRPLMWTRRQGRGRVFVCIPGHFSWTFDDPLFRLILLRGICWSGAQPAERLSDLSLIGARVAEE